jgi:hypothetical protein
MAYTATVTLDTPHAERISRNLGILIGKCDITSYNQAGAEITDITKHFKTILRVVCDGVSGNNYIVRWNVTDKCFHAFYPTNAQGAHSHKAFTVNNSELAADATAFVSITEGDGTAQSGIKVAAAGSGSDVDINTDSQGAISAAAATEVANDVDVGEVNFFAIGLI